MKISIVINCDTRDGFDSSETYANGLFSGCKSADFLTEGVLNKKLFLSGFDFETIVYVDEHKKIPHDILTKMRESVNSIFIRHHTDEPAFNDWNYYRALSMATGDIVIHFDQDTAAFCRDKTAIEKLVSHLDNYKFVSYPSPNSPNPVHDDSFGGMFWASTRFFICKRESLKLDELKKCIENPDWMYEKYGDSPRRCNWTEHFLAKINGNSVFYPPPHQDYTIFSWGSYKSGVLGQLNNMSFDEVNSFVNQRGGIFYPCDVNC